MEFFLFYFFKSRETALVESELKLKDNTTEVLPRGHKVNISFAWQTSQEGQDTSKDILNNYITQACISTANTPTIWLPNEHSSYVYSCVLKKQSRKL